LQSRTNHLQLPQVFLLRTWRQKAYFNNFAIRPKHLQHLESQESSVTTKIIILLVFVFVLFFDGSDLFCGTSKKQERVSGTPADHCGPAWQNSSLRGGNVFLSLA
jgi:hypothetical protein